MSDHHDDHHNEEFPHSSFSGYMIGFALSVILTVIPFWMVMTDALSSTAATITIILGLALVQIVVHMVYFLHMNFHSQGGWNMLSLIFTGILVFITILGSLWVMYHMNVNMMPSMMGSMSQG
ncbi:MAG: cytochrome o ubiquinol oxidase subunit IV [Alcanivorax sp.]|nr:cytochrome o ubiquinol oxidase subunit IV [Alcanivorax sp.]